MARDAPPLDAVAGVSEAALSARREAANASNRPWDLGDEVAGHADVRRAEVAAARRAARASGSDLGQILIHRRIASEGTVASARARLENVPLLDLTARPPAPDLLAAIGPWRALELGVVPWRRVGRTTVLAAPTAEAYEAALPTLSQVFEAPRFAIAAAGAIAAATHAGQEHALVSRAEARVAPSDSIRSLVLHGWPDAALICAALLIFALCTVPGALLIALTAWALLTLAATVALKAAALCATMGAKAPPPAPPEALPRMTILVALYKETDIAGHLVARLRRLSYPRERLEVLLVTESDDATTHATLAATRLPPWMAEITVPPGHVKTKPRALNYALDHCTGEFIGVYDAEDAPEPDQLLKIAAHFAATGEDVACLQGRLDFYNARANWLSRCFAMEYAAWFRVILPGLARLGLPVPLGGTTLFFRAKTLRALGGWDAHNVTEDADLGLRLVRRGWRTELADTVTFEEANCRFWPWVKQRSRWLKGYAVTYTVHMRDPRALWRDLGAWGFLGVQILFVGTLSQFLLVPLLLSFW
ncbi:MAG: glycosyltransferase, partial [Pseudomonadota bacterium]